MGSIVDSGDITQPLAGEYFVSSEGVDSTWYRATYPDIGTALDPVVHYAEHGWREGRSPNADFSVEWYRKAHRDIPIDVDPFLHYLRTGRQCGRRRAPHDYWRPEAWTYAHGGVDPLFYRERYSYDDSSMDAATHYTTHGWREGRDPNRSFSTSWYLTNNPDIASVDMDPLHHYLLSGMAEGRTPKPTLLDTIRFHEWWSHKFSSFMAVAYISALKTDVSIFLLGPLLLLMLGALTCVASYVSLINDMCDRTVDRLGNKPNRMQSRSPASIALLMSACVVPGFAFAWFWRHDALVLALYLGSWASFTLYSLPPFRFKYRSILGALSDAMGAHVFPSLLLTVLVFRYAGVSIDKLWCTLVGVWALGYGLRGILFHQGLDVANDARAGMRTFVGSLGPVRIGWLESALILPAELASLSVLLVESHSRIAMLVAMACVFLDLAAALRRRSTTSAAGSKHPVLFGFYEVQLPLALLLSSSLLDVRVLLVAIVHAGFFFRHRMPKQSGAAELARWSSVATNVLPSLRIPRRRMEARLGRDAMGSTSGPNP